MNSRTLITEVIGTVSISDNTFKKNINRSKISSYLIFCDKNIKEKKN